MARKSRPKRTLKCAQYLNRLLVVAVAALAIGLVAKWSPSSRHEPQAKSIGARPTRSIQPQMLFSDTHSETASTVQAGIWSVQGSNWNFKNETLTTSQLTHALRQKGNTSEIESDMTEHLALIDLIPAQRAQVERVGSVTTRSLDYGSIRAAISYRETVGRRFFISAKIANRVNADRWQLVALFPKTPASGNLRHLLPIGGTLTGVCQRYGKTGALQCEICETELTCGELVRNWSLQGWVVQPVCSNESKDHTSWTCVNGSQSVHVRATPSATNSRLLLVMTALDDLQSL